MTIALWRATVFVHRYLGVAVGLLMLVWFLSGIVMMYVGFPELSREDRLRSLSAISWQTCCSLAAQRFDAGDAIRSVEVETVAGEPAMFIRPENQPGRIVSLGPTGPSLRVEEPQARGVAFAAAERILTGSAESVVYDNIDHDQWTVSGDYGPHRPLFKYSFDDPDRTVIYVSSATGQVILWTTATQRFWNWLGAIPHWLYPTILRENGPLWSQAVIWSSLVGGFLTAIGLFLGIAQFKRGSSGRVSPYRGWFYWHHIVGLVFGVLTLTWVLSGTLSMSPWGFLEPGGGGGGAAARLFGNSPPWSDVRASLAAIQASPPSGEVVNLASAPLDGKLFWLASRSDGTVERLDASGKPAPVALQDLKDAAQRLAGGTAIVSEEMISEEDAYYFSHHDAVAIPAYRVILDDAEHTRFYFDPSSAQVVRRMDSNSRTRRWLFDGLHRMDFTNWLRWRPVWDIVTILLLLGGVAVTGTRTYLALSRIKRDLTFTARVPRVSEVPGQAE